MTSNPEQELRSVRLQANRIEIHCLAAGPSDGALVLLLHGFPEFSGGWLRQIPALAQAGFRVLAPDQRGYARSGKPAGVDGYRLDELAADIAGLIRTTGHRSASLVGHDWGGLVAWWTAVRHPELVTRLAILNAPHPAAARPFIRRNPSQILRSWYIGFFQLPALPEWLCRRRDFAALRGAMTGSARPGTFSPADLDRYREAWSEPGALTGMLNWYRAFRRFKPERTNPRIRQPVLILWGEKDRFLDKRLANASALFCENADIRYFRNATHWLHHEEPAAVNDALVAFFKGPEPHWS